MISVTCPRSLGGVAAPLRALVREALALEARKAGEIAIVLSDDATLRDLNRRYRGIDRATDVLSFEYGSDRAASSVSGDLVISMDRIREQAKRFRVSPGRELARLVIHGALHLAGLDHHEASERKHMRRQEDRALRAGRENVQVLERATRVARLTDRAGIGAPSKKPSRA